MEHMLQTAEAIRKAGHPDWFQLVGLLHDMGKIQYLWGAPEDGQVREEEDGGEPVLSCGERVCCREVLSLILSRVLCVLSRMNPSCILTYGCLSFSVLLFSAPPLLLSSPCPGGRWGRRTDRSGVWAATRGLWGARFRTRRYFRSSQSSTLT